ncbi:MAG: glycerate kinase, partial [Kiritimatiellae bacterium]|nr:glycerate kinase [Kiritimatiellia bacterium]
MSLRIAIAPDSFKGTLTSAQAAEAIAAGLADVLPRDAEYDCIPMADGGEGTVDAWLAATGAERVCCDALDPLGRPIRAFYGWRESDGTAVLELAAASGLPLLKPEERDPATASTYGTGLALRDAISRGARRIVLGLGGSATNDGGAGLAAALGAVFRDCAGTELPPGGLALGRLAAIEMGPVAE